MNQKCNNIQRQHRATATPDGSKNKRSEKYAMSSNMSTKCIPKQVSEASPDPPGRLCGPRGAPKTTGEEKSLNLGLQQDPKKRSCGSPIRPKSHQNIPPETTPKKLQKKYRNRDLLETPRALKMKLPCKREHDFHFSI